MSQPPISQRDRAYAEWFAWARQGTGDPGRAHAAAAAALAAQEAGQDPAATAAAAQQAAQSPGNPPADPSLERYATWFAWARQDLNLEPGRAHIAAETAVRALDQGVGSEVAARTAMGAAGMTSPAQARKRPIWPWILGGCLLATLVVVGLLVAGGFALYSTFQAGGCAPKDLVKYPDAKLASFNTQVSTSGHHCSQTYESQSSADQVTNFYVGGLSGGNWEIVNQDKSQGTIEFQRRRDHRTHGTIQVLGTGSSSRIELSIDFP